MLMRDAMAEFLNSRQAAGKRPKTIRFYSDNIGSYLTFLEHNQINGSKWAQPRTFEEFFNHERKRGLSDTSINARFRALRAFCNWLVGRGYIEQSPIAAVEEPKRTVRPPRRITLEQFQRLLNSIPTTGATWLDCRDKLIIEMLFWTGLRLGEIVALRLDDIDLDSRLLRIREAKGRRSRFVPFPLSMNETFRRCLLTRPAVETQSLYISSDFEFRPLGTLGHSGVAQMLKRRCSGAGLPCYNPHSFRHGFAMAMLNAGNIEMGVLAKILGHRSPAVTQAIYADWETTSLRRAYDLAELAIASDRRSDAEGNNRDPPN